MKDLSLIPHVKEVSETWGMHDIFVKIQTESMDEMNNIISDIRRINGIEWTVTLVSVIEYEKKQVTNQSINSISEYISSNKGTYLE